MRRSFATHSAFGAGPIAQDLAYILMRGNLDLKRPRCLLKFKWLGPVAAFESRVREWYVLIARTSPSPGQRYTVTESIETSW